MGFLRSLAVAAVALVGAMTLVPHATSAQGAGVYTAAQATAGSALYAANCSQCHGQSLEGISGPALAGKAFTDKWNGETADDLNYIMSTQMPLTAPGSLKPDEYIELVAYVLQQNKYPAGSTPLTAATLKSVKITSQVG
jgi:mono/diheme cytochrome c family protein